MGSYELIQIEDSGLSEEHIKHLAKFAREKYVEGEYQNEIAP